MPYAILRFQKRKAGSVAACERHNERKKEAYKSNPDIDVERSKYNYHSSCFDSFYSPPYTLMYVLRYCIHTGSSVKI